MSQISNDPSEPVTEPAADALVEEDLLVEDVSIDGMCGVY
jgi:mycofactocin precursor